MNRTLTLKRETLADLTDEDLRAVAGGAEIKTTPVNQCLTISFEFTCLECYTDECVATLECVATIEC